MHNSQGWPKSHQLTSQMSISSLLGRGGLKRQELKWEWKEKGDAEMKKKDTIFRNESMYTYTNRKIKLNLNL